ncbi:hypothetical protein PIB30_073852 [Stylosanthes scabra]|uniref:Aminotransferase-like plant mobile domain-containing protein n=1 Tax=Stylosanthes scabra TaxID=79078 RepID=A0ABU6YQ27_9FABA|nr:hypothetical protein [Stylosanthes scabra]
MLRQYAKCYILLFIGGYLMPDTSSNLVHIRWVPLLRDLDACAELSFLRWFPRDLDVAAWPLAPRLISYQQSDRDKQEGRLLRWREALDRSDIALFRWTPYNAQDLQAIVPEWIRSHAEIYTWRSAVDIVCFNYVHMHHIDRVLRQYGREQPVPRDSVDVTRFMTSTDRGDNRWWPDTLISWYDGWRARGTREVLVTIHECRDFRGTQEYFTWYVAACRGRFLSRGTRLDDPRWMIVPLDLPVSTIHPRDELTMPEDALARRRRGEQALRRGRRPPVQAVLPRAPPNARDRRQRERMGVVGGLDEVHEEEAEFARQEEPDDGGEHPHVSLAWSPWFDPDLIGSSSMAPPSHSAPVQAVPVSASPDPYMHDSLEISALDDVFDMVRAPELVIIQQAVSYRTARDHRLDPSSSAYVAPPPHRSFHRRCSRTLGYRYGTPPAYYDFMSGPASTTPQTETAPIEPSPPPVHQRPARAVRPPTCGTSGHLYHQGGGYM